MKLLLLLIWSVCLRTEAVLRLRSPGIVCHRQQQLRLRQIDDSLHVIVFTLPDGRYGYDIYQNKRLRIHQPQIPCIQGNRGFASRQDAQKLAGLVIKKIQAGQALPSVTMKELRALRVVTE